MSEQLNAIPPGRRRRMALALAPLGGVLLTAGVLALFRHGIGWLLVGLLVGLLALTLLGIAWGLWRSVALTEAALAEQQLDAVLTAAAGAGSQAGDSARGSTVCGSTGQLCGAGSMPSGCGAACLSRATRTGTG